jgi:hypothetical protein
MLNVALIGNHSVPHSTETHLANAWEANGHDVARIQEAPSAWRHMAERIPDDVQLVQWVTTYDYAPPVTYDDQRRFLKEIRNRGVPIIGTHLDRWWGLDREHRIRESPFFTVDLLATADGGHNAQWAEVGIEHVWMPPGVSEAECEPGTFREDFSSDVAFVGSWQGHYHREWPHRGQLVRWLRETYGTRCRFWPATGQPAVRGEALRDLYATVKVLVGDSCLAGGQTRYASDRIPETLGRGGFLIHPHVEGVTDGRLYSDGQHLLTWHVGDWSSLRDLIDGSLRYDSTRERVAELGRRHVLAGHTYEVRMRQLVAVLEQRVML